MKVLIILVASALLTPVHAIWMLRPFEDRFDELAIIAVVKVGPVTEVSTPEGLVLQSATAKIEKLIYRAYPPMEGMPKDEIILYSLLPNGHLLMTPGPLTLASGRAFVMMRQSGINKFLPSDPWEFQLIADGKLMWPTTSGIKERKLEEVISEIKAFLTRRGLENGKGGAPAPLTIESP